MKAVEIEIDGSRNNCLCFRPLPGRTVRGRFDLNRVAEPMARLKTAEFPEPIPGQRLGIQPDGTAYLAEPLHDAQHGPLRERIEKMGLKLEPAVTTFEGVHLPSWLYWMARAVQSGVARVVSGQLPDKPGGEPRRNFIMATPERSPIDKLTQALERQSALFERLLERLGEKQ